VAKLGKTFRAGGLHKKGDLRINVTMWQAD